MSPILTIIPQNKVFSKIRLSQEFSNIIMVIFIQMPELLELSSFTENSIINLMGVFR